jgi:hypothetical protein
MQAACAQGLGKKWKNIYQNDGGERGGQARSLRPAYDWTSRIVSEKNTGGMAATTGVSAANVWLVLPAIQSWHSWRTPPCFAALWLCAADTVHKERRVNSPKRAMVRVRLYCRCLSLMGVHPYLKKLGHFVKFQRFGCGCNSVGTL